MGSIASSMFKQPDIRIFKARVNTGSNIDQGIKAGNIFQGKGSDFLAPNLINNIGTDFSGSIRPVVSTEPPGALILDPNPVPKNASAKKIYDIGNQAIQIVPADSLSGANLNNLPNGFAWNKGIVTEGAPAFEGFPVQQIGRFPDALQMLRATNTFINGVVPFQPQFGQSFFGQALPGLQPISQAFVTQNNPGVTQFVSIFDAPIPEFQPMIQVNSSVLNGLNQLGIPSFLIPEIQ
jgi:hypothetical protein